MKKDNGKEQVGNQPIRPAAVSTTSCRQSGYRHLPYSKKPSALLEFTPDYYVSSFSYRITHNTTFLSLLVLPLPHGKHTVNGKISLAVTCAMLPQWTQLP
jgi:hypothetical protein